MAALCASVKIGNPAQVAGLIPAASSSQAAPKAVSLVVRASAENQQSRRSTLATIATTLAAAALSGDALAISGVKINPPPPPIGGLPGTDSSDQARDTDAPLKERFYLQGQTPEGALKRAKEAAAVLPEIEKYVSKKAWPYVRNELRSEFGYLRFDLTTVANSKPKAEKKALEKEIDDLIASIEELDYAARVKEPESAKKFFDDVSSKLSALLSKLG